MIITNITKSLNIFYDYTNYILTILFVITIFSFAQKKIVSLVAYLIFILVFLFYRHKLEVNISFDFYLFTWLKLLFKNKIVFINILGNLLLFAPLVFLIRKSELLIIITLIIGLELLQFITKRGVLDIVDITLNSFGCIIALVWKRRVYGK